MSNKNIWASIISAAIILMIAGLFYWRYQNENQANILKEQSVLDGLNQAINQSSGFGEVATPSANPLSNINSVNPLEAGNPFKNVYQNPFE